MNRNYSHTFTKGFHFLGGCIQVSNPGLEPVTGSPFQQMVAFLVEEDEMNCSNQEATPCKNPSSCRFLYGICLIKHHEAIVTFQAVKTLDCTATCREGFGYGWRTQFPKCPPRPPPSFLALLSSHRLVRIRKGIKQRLILCSHTGVLRY